MLQSQVCITAQGMPAVGTGQADMVDCDQLSKATAVANPGTGLGSRAETAVVDVKGFGMAMHWVRDVWAGGSPLKPASSQPLPWNPLSQHMIILNKAGIAIHKIEIE